MREGKALAGIVEPVANNDLSHHVDDLIYFFVGQRLCFGRGTLNQLIERIMLLGRSMAQGE
jgi:hypothetical protein